MIDVFVISFKFFNNKKYIIAFPFNFFFRLLKTRRLKYGMGDQQNRKVETMLYVHLKK